MHNPLEPVVNFLITELREARARAISPSDEFRFQVLLWRAERRTRRIERLADALAKLDAETKPE